MPSNPVLILVIALAAVVLVLAVFVVGRFRRRRGGAEDALEPFLVSLQGRLGYSFDDPALLVRAMTHSSFANEAAPGVEHNETLEFLGDAVIELITSVILMKHPRDYREGDMSRIRAMVVNKNSLAGMARKMDLGPALRMSRGERASGGRKKESLLANAYEALVGAVHLDGGYHAAERLFRSAFEKRIEAAIRGRLQTQDFKTRLQEVCQARFGCVPEYRLVAEEGPDHAKVFTSEIRFGGKVWGKGSGRSKKESEQSAAGDTLAELDLNADDEND